MLPKSICNVAIADSNKRFFFSKNLNKPLQIFSVLAKQKRLNVFTLYGKDKLDYHFSMSKFLK